LKERISMMESDVASLHPFQHQREAILTAQFDLDEREVTRYWTLSDQDLPRTDRRRRDSNRFAFAVQLCLLRFPGRHRMGAHYPHWLPLPAAIQE
jgi:hypothetical protein